jgi:hypothetical protein
MPKKNNAWLITVLALLTLLFLAGNVWQYMQSKKTTAVVAEAVTATDTIPQNPLEIKLQNAITNLKGNLLLLTDSDYSEPIKISRAINIPQDTLLIKTKGKIEFIADTSYNGAGFILAQSCKLVMLDSLTIKNFKTGVIAHSNALLLKNVKFDNCFVAVQTLFAPTGDKSVSGHLQGFNVDSTPVNNK